MQPRYVGRAQNFVVAASKIRQQLIMNEDEIQKVILSHLFEAVAPIEGGKRLVHYTSAENAYKIISGKQVWLRNTHLMNDYSEMKHGLMCLQQAWVSSAGIKFKQWLDQKWPGLSDEIVKTFDNQADGMLNATFLMSLSEHDDDEDELGRLSMWRAYGGQTGVAIILNPQIFLSETDSMGVYSTPVVYRDVAEFKDWFENWVDNLMEMEESLDQVNPVILSETISYAFRTFVLGTKHPGFHEEKEWRVFHCPLIDTETDWLSYDIEIIAGVPQHVVKVDLKDDAIAGVEGAEPSKLFNRLIIGPCDSPLPIRSALTFALNAVGVADAHDKVWMSLIPLRQR